MKNKLWLPQNQIVISIDIKETDDIWFIADTHFDHTNIIEYCSRPFGSTTEMNELILSNWNNNIKPTDLVFFVGDMSFGKNSRKPRWWLSQLNGQKIYLKGSHDQGIRPTSLLDNVLFVSDVVGVYCEGTTFLVIHDYDLKPLWWEDWVVHGHNHNNQPFIGYRRINVGVEVTDYKPTSMSRILDIIKMSETPETDEQEYERVNPEFCKRCGFRNTPLCTHPTGYYQPEPEGLNKLVEEQLKERKN